jgi:hypothetical protein
MRQYRHVRGSCSIGSRAIAGDRLARFIGAVKARKKG